MAETSSLTADLGASTEDGYEAIYIDKTIELLRQVSLLWEPPVSESVENSDDELNREINSPFDLFIGAKLSDSSFEPYVRKIIDQHDNEETLVSFLSRIPMRIFGQAAYKMHCFEVDSASTAEEQIRVFLRKFGYVHEDDRPAPEGISTAREVVESATRKLTECDESDVGSVIGQATRIGIAMENTLRFLVLFYGQFALPGVFGSFLRQQGRFRRNKSELEDWWRNSLADIERASIKHRDIRQFLVDERTQLDLSIRILRALNNYIPTAPDLAGKFSSTFERETIFPPIDVTKVSPRSKGTHKEFLVQMEEIKNLRNEINHASRSQETGGVKPDSSKVRKQALDISSAAALFFEAGASHHIFPEAILVIAHELNFRRQWRIHAKDEQNNFVKFRVPDDRMDVFLPGCEIFCWPPEYIRSRPRVALIKLWRA